MELDLTPLNGLRKRGAEKDRIKPSETQIGGEEYKTSDEVQKPLKTAPEGLEGLHALQMEADRNRQAVESSLEICKEYQARTKASSQIQTEILKGARTGESVYSLLLKACKAISFMTSNSLFYDQIERDITAIYGQGLLDPLPLQMELQGVRERLQRLEEAHASSRDPDARERIEKAIKAHQAKITELESKAS